MVKSKAKGGHSWIQRGGGRQAVGARATPWQIETPCNTRLLCAAVTLVQRIMSVGALVYTDYLVCLVPNCVIVVSNTNYTNISCTWVMG